MEIPEKTYSELKEWLPALNLLLVTANNIETFHVRQALTPIESFGDVIKVPHKNHTYFIGMFGEYACVHVQCGNMGSMEAGGAILTVASAIDDWNPKAVLMIGVAMGADDKKQRIGDVLISETIISYENQRLGKHKILQRGPIVSSGIVLSNRFKNVTNWICPVEDGSQSRILPGVILSGEKLIDNKTLRNAILAVFPQAIGAEMEGAGVYAACRNKNVAEWILIKGVCDYGDGNKSINKTARQNLAALCATSLSLKVFGSKIAFQDIGLTPFVQHKDDDISQVKIGEPDIEAEIVAMIDASEIKNEFMETPIQITVTAFLELNSYQKATVINEVGIDLGTLSNFNAHAMDKEVFRQIKERNLLGKLWAAIHEIKAFNTDKNPFDES